MAQGICFWALFLICIIQCVFIANILFHHHSVFHASDVAPPEHGTSAASPSTEVAKCPTVPTPACEQTLSAPGTLPNNTIRIATAANNPPVGVAVTLFLHAPQWFQRRYTMMIQNAISNIPDDWKVQIFYVKNGASQFGLDINPGIQKWIENGKVILTVIADEVFKTKRKKFELMVEPWLWENMLADRVLTFGGTTVLCSNSPYRIGNFSEFDYIGTPWSFKKGAGGDGAVSLRNRKAMLAAIQFELDKIGDDPAKRSTAYKSWGQEDQFFVSRLLDMKKAGLYDANIAKKEDTHRFGGNNEVFNNDILGVSGTLPAITYNERQSFFSFCPEMKMHYPALHDPSCFGASPNGTLCGSTVCALKPKSMRKGGC